MYLWLYFLEFQGASHFLYSTTELSVFTAFLNCGSLPYWIDLTCGAATCPVIQCTATKVPGDWQ